MSKTKSTRQRNFNKKVQDIVREELQEELEDKHALKGTDSTFLPSPSIPSGNVGSNANFFKLLPQIQQGDGQYNERIGNEIRLKHLDISMLFQWNYGVIFPEPSPLDYKDGSIGLRVMILRQKDNNASSGALANFQGDKLLENGNQVTGGPSDFNGRTLNLFQKINREQFSVRYDKVHYMDRAMMVNGTQVGNIAFNRPPRPVFAKHRITFGKNGLKLTFGNVASTEPTNFPYFLVMGYVSTIDSGAPSNNIIKYNISSNAVYTDA